MLSSKTSPLYVRGTEVINQTVEDFESARMFKENYENAAKKVLHSGIQKFENELDDFLAKKKEEYVVNNN
jgi:hypothetical protein